MKKLLIPLILITCPLISNAENMVFEPNKNISETRKHLVYHLRVILKACKQREPFNMNKNINSAKHVTKDCSESNKFPESTLEKKICNIINSAKEIRKEKIACAKAELPIRFTSQALAPHYLNYKKNHPPCNESKACFEQFFDDFALEHSKEWGCDSKPMISYNLLCKVFSYST